MSLSVLVLKANGGKITPNQNYALKRKKNYTKNITSNGLTGNYFSCYFSVLYKIFKKIKKKNSKLHLISLKKKISG